MLNGYGAERGSRETDHDPFENYSDEELEREVAKVIGDFEETLGVTETKAVSAPEDKYSKLNEIIRQKLESPNPKDNKFGEILKKQFEEFQESRKTKNLKNLGTQRLDTDSNDSDNMDRGTKRLDQ
ncbi:MAG: hypothetical protein IT410_02035 [Candidatus Doudnabacteria bacterium]|nr:hypothetical protein [Candidatus Doudnabacteria bacterium]